MFIPAPDSPSPESLVLPEHRILSGMRPTGALHLGHYFGVLKNWLSLAARAQCFYFVADWHALTTEYQNPRQLEEYTVEMVRDWLAVGLDPEHLVIFRQSDLNEHLELFMALAMITPLPWLMRVPSFKEQQQALRDRDLNTYGFLGYPLLQTADILLYKAHWVPVGADQLPHLELAREVVRHFHHLYGETLFPEPQPLLTQAPRVPGTDGRKMSKSFGNALYLSEPISSLKHKILKMVTDPARVRRSDPGNPDICPVFSLHQLCTPNSQREEIAVQCRSATIGCVDCKEVLIDHLGKLLAPIQERRQKISLREVGRVLSEGAAKARDFARATLAEVFRIIGFRR